MSLRKRNKTNWIPIFYLISVLFTVLNLGGPYLDISSRIFTGVFILTVFFFFLKTLHIGLSKKVLLFFVFFIPLAILNSLFSIEFLNSGVYWMMWIMFIIALIKVVQRINREELEIILYHIPYILFVASILLYVILFPYLGASLTTKNSLGLLSGATLIAAISINHKWRRIAVMLVALIILIQSDSRSSLVFAVGISALSILAKFNLKNSPIYVIGVILLIILQAPLYSFFEQKMLKKELYATNLKEAIDSAQKERTDLLKVGWELYKEKPLLGWGLKSKYYEGRVAIGPGVYAHVHNGYLGTLIETGLFMTFMVVIIIIAIFKKLFKLIFLTPSSFDKVWLFFVIFGFIRSYGENYLFFNIGNIFSIFFLFFCTILLTNHALSIALLQNNSSYQINNRNRRFKY